MNDWLASLPDLWTNYRIILCIVAFLAAAELVHLFGKQAWTDLVLVSVIPPRSSSNRSDAMVQTYRILLDGKEVSSGRLEAGRGSGNLPRTADLQALEKKALRVRVSDRAPHEVAVEISTAGKADRRAHAFPKQRWWVPRRGKTWWAAWFDESQGKVVLERYDLPSGEFRPLESPRPQ